MAVAKLCTLHDFFNIKVESWYTKQFQECRNVHSSPETNCTFPMLRNTRASIQVYNQGGTENSDNNIFTFWKVKKKKKNWVQLRWK